MCLTALLPPPPTPITLMMEDCSFGKSNFISVLFRWLVLTFLFLVFFAFFEPFLAFRKYLVEETALGFPRMILDCAVLLLGFLILLETFYHQTNTSSVRRTRDGILGGLAQVFVGVSDSGIH